MAVTVDGAVIDVGPARQRCVLAALAVDAGRVVSVDRLIGRVWAQDAPPHARATLMSYLSRLRGVLGDAVVVRRTGGYALQVDRSVVDLHRFHDLCARARAADDRQAVALWRQALGLWRGEALTGVDGEWAAGERDRLDQERWEAECDLADALLRLGHGEDLVADLTARAGRRPLDERVAGQYVLALHRAGRTADALAHYRRVRQRLVEELGAEPGAALRELHRRVLDADPALGASAATAVVPRQLPAPPGPFTGRVAELARLDEARTAGTVLISAIGGAGGIGKTWLALAWAHRHADEFPDGQLFVDLRGFSPDGRPVPPEAALSGFLTALGTAPDRVPAALEDRSALFRSLVADRRVLVVLDNAATADQVVPLLPGNPACAALVTGRTRLASLIDRHGARHLNLDVLSPDEARALLAARLGDRRVAAEPDAADELIALCGRYPLALSITARQAHTRPAVPLAELAAELRDLGLEALDHDTGLPAVLSWSLRDLTGEQRTAFALLGIAPGPDIGLPAATALTGRSPTWTRAVLRVLEDVSLVERRPGNRYAMHDLVRAYAATLAPPEPQRRAALERVVDFYLHTALAADRLLDPHASPIRPDPPAPGVHPHPLPDQAAALAWLDAEHAHLLAAQHTAAAGHRHRVVWQLARALIDFHQRTGRFHDELVVWRAALDAAEHLPDPATRIRAHRNLGSAHARLGRHEEATTHLHRSLDLAERHHATTDQAATHYDLALAWGARGDDRRALDHARRAVELYRQVDRPVWEAVALNATGWYAARLGDHDTAREHCRAALALNREHHHPDGEADTLDSLGWIDHRTGRHREAVGHYHRALDLYRTLGNTYMAANTLDGLGHPHLALGEHDLAREAWREALALYREQGRDDDAERVRRQLDDLDRRPATDPGGRGARPRA
ncbi:AfsR/SARP family transcriptional regulator [Saccharothrix syringae]|nr:BTAD domain-containing putative transcriptional regulator [Saccharothrix syringae]